MNNFFMKLKNRYVSIWSVAAMAERLVKNQVTEFDKFARAVLMVLVAIFLPILSYHFFGEWPENFDPDTVGIMKVIFFAAAIFVWLVPVLFLFNSDQRHGGKHFFERFVCLADPLLSQAVAEIFIAFTLIRWLIASVTLAAMVKYAVFAVVLGVFYGRMNTWLRYTASSNAD